MVPQPQRTRKREDPTEPATETRRHRDRQGRILERAGKFRVAALPVCFSLRLRDSVVGSSVPFAISPFRDFAFSNSRSTFVPHGQGDNQNGGAGDEAWA